MASNTPRLDRHERNLAVGGGLDFWQRQISFSNLQGTAPYTADRWGVFGGPAGGSVSVVRSTDVPTVAQSGFQPLYSLQLTNATSVAPGSSDVQGFRYRLEGYDYAYLHANYGRFSFWVKSSLPGTYAVSLRNSGLTRGYVTPITVNAANTWELKTIDAPMDSSGTWLFDNGVGLNLTIALSAGSGLQTSTTNTWQASNATGLTGQTQFSSTAGAVINIAMLQINPGQFDSSVVIPFQRSGRTIGDELAMCQRYYEKSYGVAVVPGTSTEESLAVARAASTSEAYSSFYYSVTKRTTPSVSIFSVTGTSGALSLFSSNTNVGSGYNVGAGHGSDRGFSRINGSASLVAGDSYRFHWVADSEL